MPSSITGFEVASLFGAFDSGALIDGTPASSRLLRGMAMAAHRLLVKRETVIAEAWDVDGTDDEAPAPSGVSWPFWVEVGRWPIAKMARRDRYDVSLGFRAAIGVGLEIQVCTGRTPWVSAPDPSSIISATGTGAFQSVSKAGIAGLSGHEDEISIYLRGSAFGALGDTATYGTPNTGNILRFIGGGIVYPNGASTWNTAAPTWAYRHVLVVLDGPSGFQAVEPRLIVGVGNDTSGRYLAIAPPLDPASTGRLGGKAFEIRELFTWRMSHLTVYTQERVL